MSDRKAVNRYYPPDFDPQKHKSINKYRNSHPLRERARKLSQGILVIRFEMPYNIWCEGCGNHVGMGVRYNAEKKKVGNYYTTPIYQFRMKCHLCDNYYVIETDPQNCDYKIIEGARRKNQKWDMADNEQVLTEDREVIKKRSRDPMYKLEHGVEDGKKLKAVIPTLSQIEDMQETWKDDYMQNKMLRNKFREEKKAFKVAEEKDQALLAKSSLDIALVEENEEDKKLAALMKYNAVESFDDKQKHTREAIKNRPLFAPSKSSSTISKEASAINLPTGMNGSKNLEDIQKRLGLNKLKTSRKTVFGDFDSPGNKRSNKSSSNLGIVVAKKKKTSRSSDMDSAPAEPSDGQERTGSKTRTNVQDLITGDSNVSELKVLNSSDSVLSDKSRTSSGSNALSSNQDQVLKSHELISVASIGSSDMTEGGCMPFMGSIGSDMPSTKLTSKRPVLLCDYTSSSESD